MGDFITMQDRIADEMARDDLGEHIRQSIYDSINRYKNELFFFNRKLDTTTTVAGTQTLPQPADTISFDSIFLTAYGYRRALSEVTIEQILAYDQFLLSNQGTPTQYALLGPLIYLYPIPDRAYSVTMLYRRAVPAPVSDGDGDQATDDSYFWMTTAERMIRTYAKGVLYRDVLKDEDSSRVEFDSSAKEYSVLLQRTGEAVIPDFVMPWDRY
jgi:hypothetical protein